MAARLTLPPHVGKGMSVFDPLPRSDLPRGQTRRHGERPHPLLLLQRPASSLNSSLLQTRLVCSTPWIGHVSFFHGPLGKGPRPWILCMLVVRRMHCWRLSTVWERHRWRWTSPRRGGRPRAFRFWGGRWSLFIGPSCCGPGIRCRSMGPMGSKPAASTAAARTPSRPGHHRRYRRLLNIHVVLIVVAVKWTGRRAG